MKEIPTEVYSRCCGYFRPVKQWNKGKQSEFNDRLEYKIPTEEQLDECRRTTPILEAGTV